LEHAVLFWNSFSYFGKILKIFTNLEYIIKKFYRWEMLEYCADIPPAWNDCRPHKTHKKMRASGVQLYEDKGELRQETPKKSTTP